MESLTALLLAEHDFGRFLNVGLNEFFIFMQAMAKSGNYILILTFMTVTTASFYDAFANRQLEQMKKLVDILHEKLITEECPDPEQQRYKRSVLETSSDGIQLEAYKELYTHLVDLLIICRKAKQETSPTTTKTTITTPTSTAPATIMTATTTKPMVMTTTPSTTTIPTTATSTPLPVECVNAINLTESWRLDHDGSHIRPINGGYNCDARDMINSGRPWFRFSGSGGTKLLDSCPPAFSCGTAFSLWSNSTMPSAIGVVTGFTAQGSWEYCDEYPRQASVMRCSSAPSDFVYRYDDSSDWCNFGFCGMD